MIDHAKKDTNCYNCFGCIINPIVLSDVALSWQTVCRRREDPHRHKIFKQEYDEFIITHGLKKLVINLAKANNKSIFYSSS